jgi:hypothetical protein
MPKPMTFFHRHRAEKDSKLDLDLLTGEDFSILPSILLLLGGQCTVPGGSSELFSVFEPNGWLMVTPVDVLVLTMLIWHVGSSFTSSVDASVV